MNSVFERTHDLLNKIKDQKNAHKLDLKLFKALFTEDPGEVSKAIQNCLLQVLQVFKKHPQSEKAVRAVVTMLEELLSLYTSEEVKQLNNDIFRTFAAVFRLLLQGLEAKDKAVRQGCAYVMERYCNLGIHTTVDLPVTFCQQLDCVIVLLLRDKDTQVRQLAAKLARYSVHKDVVTELIRASRLEKAAEVRKQAIRSMCLAQQGKIHAEFLEAVLDRLRDKDEAVRIEAWNKVSEVALTEMQSVADRRRVVVAGMVDRSERVRELCKHYIKRFLAAFDQGLAMEDVGPHHAPVAFMALMSIDDLPLDMEQGVSRALAFILKEVLKPESMIQLIQDDLLPALLTVLRDSGASISNSHLLLLRYMLQCLKNLEVKTEEHIPEMRLMCDLLEHFTRTQDVFKLHQVMCITRCMDLAEEPPKRLLLATLKKVLVELPVTVDFGCEDSVIISRQYHDIGSGVEFVRTGAQLVDQIAIYLRELLSDHEAEFSRNLIEVINDIRDPLMKPLEQDDPLSQLCGDQPNLFDKQEYLRRQLGQFKDESESLEAEMEQYIQQDKYVEAKQVRIRIEKLRETCQSVDQELNQITETMGELLMKSLLVTSALLRHCKQDFVTDEIVELINTLVKPSLELERNDIRCVAVECVGLFALLRKELCTRYLGMFRFVLTQGEGKLLTWYALKAILDAFLLHDFLMAEDAAMEDERESPAELLDLLLSFLDNGDENIRALVAEGVGKLLFLRRLPQPEVALARLLLLSCSHKCPRHASQILQVFFLTYPLLSQDNTRALEEAFKLCLLLFITITERKEHGHADKLDPADLNINKMFEFTFTYTNWDQLEAQAKYKPTRHFHFALFNFFCMESLQEVSADARRLYINIACQAKLHNIGSRELDLAFWLIESATPKVSDAKERKMLLKVKETLKVREGEVRPFNDPEFREAQRQVWVQSHALCRDFARTVLGVEVELQGPSQASLADDPLELDENEDPPLKRSPAGEELAARKKVRKSEN